VFDKDVYDRMKDFLDVKYMNRYRVYVNTLALYGEGHFMTSKAARLLHQVKGRELQALEIYRSHGDNTGSPILDSWVKELRETCHA
jgi:hypothetical protein